MDWFVVKYRKPDGTMTEAEFEAADKSALFKLLAEEKISAISINPGRLTKKATPPLSSPSRIRGIFAGIVVVVVAIASWYFLSSDQKATSDEKTDTAKKQQSAPKPVPAVKATSKDTPDATPLPDLNNAVQKAVADVYPKTNADGSIIKKLKNGKTYLVRPRGKDWKKKYPFDNPVETQLSWYAIPGAEVPPLLPMVFTEADITDALTHRIEIDPEDDDDTIAIKESVSDLKEQLKTWLKAGGTVDDYIKQLARRQALEAESVNESRKLVMEALNAGDIGLAKELQEKLNKHLTDNGIPAVRLPRKYRELIDNYKEE